MLRKDAVQDSEIPIIPEEALPNISMSQANELDARLNDYDTISAIFLLLDNYEQAYSYCVAIEAGQRPFGDYPGFISVLIHHIHRTDMANGYNKIYCTLYILNRFRASREVLNVSKNRLETYFATRVYHYLPSLRLALFKLCQRWTRDQWSEIVINIRSLYSLSPKDLCCREIETNLIQMFLKDIIVNDGPNLNFKQSLEQISPELLSLFTPSVASPPTADDNRFQTSRGGFVLIINIENYKKPEFSKRRGSRNDVRTIQKTFRKFGCNISVESDLDGKGIHDVIKEYSTNQNYNPFDYFILFILAHGTHDEGRGDVIFGTDGVPVKVNTIRDAFIRVKNCRSLVRKPKIFFIQACRGSESMLTYELPPSISKDSHFAEIDGCLVFKSTWEGYASYRHDLHGSFFIQYLCREIQEFGGKRTLSEHCNAVQDHLRTVNRKYAQIASYDYSLGSKQFYFTATS